jgi:outer membrane protein OmpA-like peptidoglycan-associated protein
VRRSLVWLASCLGVIVSGALALAQQRNFVACPIVRDTKTVPCFLAEYDGRLYFLGIQQDIASEFHPPQLKHEVLVEGRIAEGPGVCGGIPLQPLSISTLKEINPACNTLLPAEPGIDAPPAPRGPGPSSSHSEAASAPRQSLTGPREFTVFYAFDDDYLEYAASQVVGDAAAYARGIGSSNVKVAGYRATTLLSSGDRLVEKAGLAEKRAQSIATILRGLGVAGVTVEWKNEPEPGDGRSDPSRRRVAILVTP